MTVCVLWLFPHGAVGWSAVCDFGMFCLYLHVLMYFIELLNGLCTTNITQTLTIGALQVIY